MGVYELCNSDSASYEVEKYNRPNCLFAVCGIDEDVFCFVSCISVFVNVRVGIISMKLFHLILPFAEIYIKMRERFLSINT